MVRPTFESSWNFSKSEIARQPVIFWNIVGEEGVLLVNCLHSSANALECPHVVGSNHGFYI